MFEFEREVLMPVCKDHLAQIREAVEEVQEACVDDYAIFLQQPSARTGRIAECLEKNEYLLTPKCKSVLKEVTKKPGKFSETNAK